MSWNCGVNRNWSNAFTFSSGQEEVHMDVDMNVDGEDRDGDTPMKVADLFKKQEFNEVPNPFGKNLDSQDFKESNLKSLLHGVEGEKQSSFEEREKIYLNIIQCLLGDKELSRDNILNFNSAHFSKVKKDKEVDDLTKKWGLWTLKEYKNLF